jgi:hypothetical protein
LSPELPLETKLPPSRDLGMSAFERERIIEKARSVVMPHSVEAMARLIIAPLQPV